MRLGGRFMEVPIGSRHVRLLIELRHLDPNYEADTIQAWLALLAPGETAWDVGANIGLFTLLAGQQVGPTGRVITWEPSPVTCRITRDHVIANNLSEIVTVHQAAISDRAGSMPFSVSSDYSTDRLGGEQQGSNTIHVRVETLDSHLSAGTPVPVCVKIDVEGAEVFALRGAKELMSIGGPRPIILLAVHPMFLPEFNCRPEELVELTAKADYLSFSMIGELASPTEYAEYVLVPREKEMQTKQKLGWKVS